MWASKCSISSSQLWPSGSSRATYSNSTVKTVIVHPNTSKNHEGWGIGLYGRLWESCTMTSSCNFKRNEPAKPLNYDILWLWLEGTPLQQRGGPNDLEKITALKRFMFQVSRSTCDSTGAKHQDYSERTQQTSADSSTATSFRHSHNGNSEKWGRSDLNCAESASNLVTPCCLVIFS